MLVLRDRRDRGAEDHFRVTLFLQMGEQAFRELPLLALQAIGMARLPRQHRQIEHRPVAVRMQADLPMGADEPARHQIAGDAIGLQQIKGRRMEGRGAQIQRNGGLRLEHPHGHASPAQEQRKAQPDWPAPRDDDFAIAAFIQHATVPVGD